MADDSRPTPIFRAASDPLGNIVASRAREASIPVVGNLDFDPARQLIAPVRGAVLGKLLDHVVLLGDLGSPGCGPGVNLRTIVGMPCQRAQRGANSVQGVSSRYLHIAPRPMETLQPANYAGEDSIYVRRRQNLIIR